MWIVQKIKRESLVIQLPDSSLTELNNYNFYSKKQHKINKIHHIWAYVCKTNTKIAYSFYYILIK